MSSIAKYTFGLICIAVALLCSCEKNDYISDSDVMLKFSLDELNFDTIFAPLGSTTYQLTVHNRSNTNLKIDQVMLLRGAASPFVMNVDGRSGVSIDNVKLAKKDSMYIFVEVKQNQALLNIDSILFKLGASKQYLLVKSYGQECIVISDSVLPNNYTFTSEKPYLIVKTTSVAMGNSANIADSATLYFGKNCGLNVHGTLLITGTSESRARLTYIRANEEWYANLSSQWNGLYFSSTSTNNAITFAEISGAANAIVVEDTLQLNTAQVQLKINNTIVKHANIGLQSNGAYLQIANSLFASASRNALLLKGGTYQVYNSTIGSPYSRFVELVSLSNGKYPLANSLFAGCIIYGNNQTELNIESGLNSYTFDHCILKLSSSFNTSDTSHYKSIYRDNPNFVNALKDDFHLKSDSPAIGIGTNEISALYPLDLDGNYRSSNDVGAYTYKPK
ncbi:MAG: hypothetical protein LBK47_02085 [Prevotellaceae bacterium]|jgi:hypothetical protein|nr:hypothetical protein [Prevotellaceae bacterium]